MMMVPMRPDMLQNAHLLSRLYTSQPLPSIHGKPQKTDAPNASFGCFTD
jgi:hypothetical protein